MEQKGKEWREEWQETEMECMHLERGQDDITKMEKKPASILKMDILFIQISF